MRPIVVTPHLHREVRWRNGGGTSFQIWPRGTISGRAGFQLNLTPISEGGPFSHYPGIDRVLAVASGGGLAFEGRDGQLDAGDAIAFAGEAAMKARLEDGPVTVFNLLLRRAAWAGSAETLRGRTIEVAPRHGELAVVHLAAGRWRATAGQRRAGTLVQASTLILRPAETLVLQPDEDGAMGLVFVLRRRP